MIERRGHVVVVASVYAFVNGVMATPYAMSKAGVEQLGRALRGELSIHGASASVAYFGFIDTKMVRDALADPAARAMSRRCSRSRQPAPAPVGGRRGDRRRDRARASRGSSGPRWWRAYSVLRGIVNPLLDARVARDERLRDAVREASASPGRRRPSP